MNTQYSVEEIFNENSKMCNHILKLSKINNPELWKKFGKPHISIWVGDNVSSANHLFHLEWGNNRQSISVAFHYKDVNKSLKQFKEERRKHIKYLKKLGIYKKTTDVPVLGQKDIYPKNRA